MSQHTPLDLPLDTALLAYLTASEEITRATKTTKPGQARFHFARTTPNSPTPSKAPRHTVSRPQSPKGKEAGGCCVRMASPSGRTLKRDSLEKQLEQWRERAQVWSKEKQALERRLERLLQAQEPFSANKWSDDACKSKDLIGVRQDAKIAEQTATIKALREEVERLRILEVGLTFDPSAARRPLLKRRDLEELREANSHLSAKLAQLQRENEELAAGKQEAVRQLTTAGITQKVIFAEIAALTQDCTACKRLAEEANSAPTSAATSFLEDSPAYLEKLSEEGSEKLPEDLIRRLEADQREKRVVIIDLCGKLQKAEEEKCALAELLASAQNRELIGKIKVQELETEVKQKDYELAARTNDSDTLQTTVNEQKAVYETLTAQLSQTQDKLISAVRIMSELELKQGEALREIRELQQKNSALESALTQATSDLSELRIVLESTEDPNLETVDVRGLARVLLSQDKFKAFLSYVGPDFQGIVGKFEQKIADLEEKLRQTRAVSDDQIESLQLQLEALSPMRSGKYQPLKIPVIPRIRTKPSVSSSSQDYVTFLTVQAQALEELIS